MELVPFSEGFWNYISVIKNQTYDKRYNGIFDLILRFNFCLNLVQKLYKLG